MEISDLSSISLSLGVVRLVWEELEEEEEDEGLIAWLFDCLSSIIIMINICIYI